MPSILSISDALGSRRLSALCREFAFAVLFRPAKEKPKPVGTKPSVSLLLISGYHLHFDHCMPDRYCTIFVQLFKEAVNIVTPSQTADLDSVIQQVWIDLGHGVVRARHPYHTPALVSLDRGQPSARTVVLRRVDATQRQLICHTDIRSPKVQAFREQPNAAWLFYDRDGKTQLRMEGTVQVHHDDELAETQWLASAERSRICYATSTAPSTAVADPVPATPLTSGVANFAVVNCTVRMIDWLFLRHEGHLRARFTWQQETWHGEWLAP